jgi:hypothetical protein
VVPGAGGQQIGRRRLDPTVTLLPFVVGVFWGAPLVSREFETGTQDVVWQQSVPRHRWLATKLGLVGLAAVAAAGLIAFPVTWWSRPLDATAFTGLNRMSPGVFDARGTVVLGHTAFAFAVGVAAGLLIRRPVVAMAVTVAIVIAALIIMPAMVRPHLADPVRLESVIAGESHPASMPRTARRRRLPAGRDLSPGWPAENFAEESSRFAG